jgi:N-acyl amino acid synthase of PEP-CTERM/exosortase system
MNVRNLQELPGALANGARSKLSSYDYYSLLFEARPACDPVLLRECHRLRYQVYCTERGIADASLHPDGLETDAYDRHSLSALLIYRPERIAAGTIRLVLPSQNGVPRPLPTYDLLAAAGCDLGKLPALPRTAEISRFAIPKAFRRRAGEGAYGNSLDALEADPLRRVIPHLTLGLMAAALRMASDNGIEHVCAIMEPALLRLLARFGMRFIPSGPLIDHHGWRQPCHAPIAQLCRDVAAQRPEAWDIISEGGGYDPAVAARTMRMAS